MAGLTKQHFEKIAEIIKGKSYLTGQEEKVYFVQALADYFKTQNPLFNENQFKKACLE